MADRTCRAMAACAVARNRAADDVENFYFFSRRVAEGSRLRLFIRPANMVSNQRNYNSGKEVARETSADARTATVKLHLGPDTPARLVLPVVE